LKRLAQIIIFFVVAIGAGESFTAQPAKLEIRIKDHREAIGDFSRVIVNLSGISISPNPGWQFWQTGWTTLKLTSSSVDLTRYTGKESAAVFRGAVAAGKFEAIDLQIASIDAIVKKGSRAVTVNNRLHPIKLAFETTAQAATVIVLDLVVLDMSDHPPAGYELDLNGYELYTNGKLVDKIPPG
jgi:Domain of unknown function (DUF4382)